MRLKVLRVYFLSPRFNAYRIILIIYPDFERQSKLGGSFLHQGVDKLIIIKDGSFHGPMYMRKDPMFNGIVFASIGRGLIFNKPLM